MRLSALQTVENVERSPSPLPKDFEDSVAQAVFSTKTYLASGGRAKRLVIEFDTSVNDVTYTSIKNTMPFLKEFSSQLANRWDGTEGSNSTTKPATIFFPDMGAAALARRDWMMQTNQSSVPLGVSVASIQYDKPKANDFAALIACPLYSEVDNVQRIADLCTDQEIPCILLNPALVNNDQGYGVRKF
jgi:hypothetical protein